MHEPLYRELMLILPIASLLSVLLTYVDLVASMANLAALRLKYERTPKDEETDKKYPPIHTCKKCFAVRNHFSFL
jgi:hypothetical protein